MLKGEEKKVYQREYMRSYMRKKRSQEARLKKGGRHRTPSGYILVKVLKDDFFAPMRRSRGYILEHRLVMAHYLNRCLLSWEVVHHRNGQKDDNRVENLSLLPGSYKHSVITRMERHIKRLEDKVEALEKMVKGV